MFQDYLKSSSLFISFLSLPHLWKQTPSHLFSMYVILNWANFVIYVYESQLVLYLNHRLFSQAPYYTMISKISVFNWVVDIEKSSTINMILKKKPTCWVWYVCVRQMIILSKLIPNIYVSIHKLFLIMVKELFMCLIIVQSAENNDCFIQPQIRHQHWYQY